MEITLIEGLYIRHNSTSRIDIKLLCILKVFLAIFQYFSTDEIVRTIKWKVLKNVLDKNHTMHCLWLWMDFNKNMQRVMWGCLINKCSTQSPMIDSHTIGSTSIHLQGRHNRNASAKHWNSPYIYIMSIYTNSLF